MYCSARIIVFGTNMESKYPSLSCIDTPSTVIELVYYFLGFFFVSSSSYRLRVYLLFRPHLFENGRSKKKKKALWPSLKCLFFSDATDRFVWNIFFFCCIFNCASCPKKKEEMQSSFANHILWKYIRKLRYISKVNKFEVHLVRLKTIWISEKLKIVYMLKSKALTQ